MIGLKSYIFLFVVLYNHSAHGDEFIKLEISQGILVGKVLKSRNNLDYYAFLSIPYAKADRFEVNNNFNRIKFYHIRIFFTTYNNFTLFV